MRISLSARWFRNPRVQFTQSTVRGSSLATIYRMKMVILHGRNSFGTDDNIFSVLNSTINSESVGTYAQPTDVGDTEISGNG
jgi:hypothetical protein